MDTRRQNKISALLQETFANILLRLGKGIYGKAFVTVSNVKVTPDLSVARYYLSIFNTDDKEFVLGQIEHHRSELKRELGEQLRFQLRKMPEPEFYIDDTLDEVFRMEEVFKKLKEE